MINTITICPDGHLIPESDCLGRTGEHKATVLWFNFFESLNGKSAIDFRKELVAVNSQGSFKYELTVNKFPIPLELTTDTELSLQVKLYDADELVFKSNLHIFTFSDSIDDSGKNAIQSVVDKAKESYRTDLASSLETATGEAQDGKAWDELNETVAGLPVLKEEQVQTLGNWDLIKTYFENYSGKSHNLFTQSPSADGINIPYRLPYIYTPSLPWPTNITMLSKDLLEAGVDVSSAVNLGGGGTSRTFSPLPKLEKLILTGNAENPSLYNFMCTNYELRYIKMETPSKTVLNANAKYYDRAFYRCERLQTIDCELDFTGQTDTAGMFTNCYMLKDLRIKPFTLTCSLDVRSCKYFVHPEIIDSSLLSILNAIPNPKVEGENAGITITYSNEAWLMGSMGTDGTLPLEFMSTEVYFNPETGLYSYEKQTESDEKMPMLEAFVDRKGVTLATP